MAIRKEEEKHVSWFASGSTYRDRPGQGTFSMPDLVSQHAFGWDCKELRFVREDQYGSVVGSVPHYLPMPLELAEAFMFECIDPRFNDEFLRSPYPNDAVEKVIEAAGLGLKVSRSAATLVSGTSRYYMPGLSLSIVGATPNLSLGLFHELRQSLGERTKRLSRDEVQQRLREP